MPGGHNPDGSRALRETVKAASCSIPQSVTEPRPITSPPAPRRVEVWIAVGVNEWSSIPRERAAVTSRAEPGLPPMRAAVRFYSRQSLRPSHWCSRTSSEVRRDLSRLHSFSRPWAQACVSVARGLEGNLDVAANAAGCECKVDGTAELLRDEIANDPDAVSALGRS
jgi:hypothetical protein